MSEKMHEGLKKEIATYEKRTPKSAEAHKRALQRIPLGSSQQLSRLRSLSHFREERRRQ